MTTLRWQIGDVRISRVEEAMNQIAVTDFMPNATQEEAEAHRSWLEPHYIDDEGLFTMSFHSLVVEADGLVILVDTCFGEHKHPEFAHLFPSGDPGSVYFPNLKEAGFTPEDVDVVLCTHLHFDHIGWNTRYQDGKLVPTFPNATYLFGREEWEYWDDVDPVPVVGATVEVAVRPLVESGQAQLVEKDHRISASCWLEPTPGHSPAHVAVHIESAGESALLAGDSILTPVQLAEPHWAGVGDYDAEQSTATRRRLIEDYADEDILVFAAHFPPPCCGKIVRTPDGVRFVDA
jgi:glyoxylase-like metal-dependent hydrolase (beta-lactamase superfamily II)